ncbi:arabinogalactan protein 1-like [Lactuca sativa]|uniref:arabinogalactan protein 1-like n=1 Tax=Lactuca sativa TaxID=4236 RepID=UPI001C68F85A|nr:arabinogalactan protein 1-like [Lactuca sativa]
MEMKNVIALAFICAIIAAVGGQVLTASPMIVPPSTVTTPIASPTVAPPTKSPVFVPPMVSVPTLVSSPLVVVPVSSPHVVVPMSSPPPVPEPVSSPAPEIAYTPEASAPASSNKKTKKKNALSSSPTGALSPAPSGDDSPSSTFSFSISPLMGSDLLLLFDMNNNCLSGFIPLELARLTRTSFPVGCQKRLIAKAVNIANELNANVTWSSKSFPIELARLLYSILKS